MTSTICCRLCSGEGGAEEEERLLDKKDADGSPVEEVQKASRRDKLRS